MVVSYISLVSPHAITTKKKPIFNILESEEKYTDFHSNSVQDDHPYFKHRFKKLLKYL